MKFSIEVKPTPEQLAAAWWELFADEQARFFNEIARLTVEAGDEASLYTQLQCVRDSYQMDEGGRRVMRLIGEYAE